MAWYWQSVLLLLRQHVRELTSELCNFLMGSKSVAIKVWPEMSMAMSQNVGNFNGFNGAGSSMAGDLMHSPNILSHTLLRGLHSGVDLAPDVVVLVYRQGHNSEFRQIVSRAGAVAADAATPLRHLARPQIGHAQAVRALRNR